MKRQAWFIALADECGCAGKTDIPLERVQYLSALEVCSWRGAIQIHVYLYLHLYHLTAKHKRPYALFTRYDWYSNPAFWSESTTSFIFIHIYHILKIWSIVSCECHRRPFLLRTGSLRPNAANSISAGPPHRRKKREGEDEQETPLFSQSDANVNVSFFCLI